MTPPLTEGRAVASLGLGLLSLLLVGPLAGLPAIVLGAIARREIERSNGHLAGRGLAAGGIVTGLFGTGLGVVAALWLVGAAFTADVSEATEAEMPLSLGAAPPSDSTDDLARKGGTQSYGSLEVVDLDVARPLRPQLTEIVDRAHGRAVLLQTFQRSSATCDALAAALPGARMQGALANVTIVRVDVEEYSRDLVAMSIETRSAPSFYRLDSHADPTDSLSAADWDRPEAMAPVLGWFAQRPALRSSPAAPSRPRKRGRRSHP